MPRRRPIEVTVSELLRDCERWTTNITWPAPIDKRINDLCDAAKDAGEADTLSRGEMVAALVLAAPLDGDRLVELLRTLRKATVRESLVRQPEKDEAKVIVLQQRRPGRR